jgi:hypothetical protein
MESTPDFISGQQSSKYQQSQRNHGYRCHGPYLPFQYLDTVFMVHWFLLG